MDTRKIISVTGTDREDFLQNLVTNDVTRVKEGLVWTALLTPQGKYLADFFLVPGDPTRSLKELRQIRMVVSDGVVYFPSEIYPWFGIRPFSEIPQVTGVVDASVPGTATGN